MVTAELDIERARFNMIEQQIRPWEVLNPEVLDLLALVKREEFVPSAQRALAFADLELPIGQGQTMLAPKIDARILQELHVKNTDMVLEIGAGSGYMAALLAARAEYVHTVEINSSLAELAKRNLRQAGVANVSVETGDGSNGWPGSSAYDVIVVSGSLPQLPPAFLKQLKIGGRLTAFIGQAPVMHAQLITRSNETAYTTVNLFETIVAPLTAKKKQAFVF